MKTKIEEILKLIQESNLSDLEKQILRKKMIELIEEIIKFYTEPYMEIDK